MIRRTIFLPWLVTLIISVTQVMSQTNTTGRNPIGIINKGNKRYTVNLNPGETIRVKYTFDAELRHTAFIREDGVGVKKFVKRESKTNSNLIRRSPGEAAKPDYSYSKKNETTKVIVIEIDDNVSKREGSKWLPIKIRMEAEKDNYAKIGWEDSVDGDFDDAQAEVWISQQ